MLGTEPSCFIPDHSDHTAIGTHTGRTQTTVLVTALQTEHDCFVQREVHLEYLMHLGIATE